MFGSVWDQSPVSDIDWDPGEDHLLVSFENGQLKLVNYLGDKSFIVQKFEK